MFKLFIVGEIGVFEFVGCGIVVKMMFVLIFKVMCLCVLVIGGVGFVGSYFVDRFMERGNIVIVVDNFFIGCKENIMYYL